MNDTDSMRLEGKVDSILVELRDMGKDLAKVSQWKADREPACERNETRIDQLGRDLDAERQARTLAVAKVREVLGRRIGAQAAVAALVGALIPGLVLLVMLWNGGGTP